MQLSNVFVSIFGVWLLIVSAAVLYVYIRFNKLTKDVHEGNLLQVLEKVFTKEAVNSKAIKKLETKLDNYAEENLANVQKLGLVRFNPFNEVGGDHSFAIALLTGRDDGFVLTGLHARERTRLYIKPVKKGVSEYELSKEEKNAVALALKQ